MRGTGEGKTLINDLLRDSKSFSAKGRSYDLLQHYFHGLKLETLRPLLSNGDQLVRSSAVWIASELGAAAGDLVVDVVPLIYEQNRSIAFYALEVVAVCATGEHAALFTHVVQALDHEDEAMRRLAMRMVADVNDPQLRAFTATLQGAAALRESHKEGLLALLNIHAISAAQVSQMLAANDPILKRYGAMCARRLVKRLPELISAAASLVDSDISRFASETIEDNLNA